MEIDDLKKEMAKISWYHTVESECCDSGCAQFSDQVLVQFSSKLLR